MATTGAPCAHPRLDFLDPDQHRGWLCTDCGESGPTVVRAADMASQFGQVMGVRALCVCGSGYEWPFTATGAEVARWLAGHAGCKPAGAPGGALLARTAELLTGGAR